MTNYWIGIDGKFKFSINGYRATIIFDKDWKKYIAFVEKIHDSHSSLQYIDDDEEVISLMTRTENAMKTMQ